MQLRLKHMKQAPQLELTVRFHQGTFILLCRENKGIQEDQKMTTHRLLMTQQTVVLLQATVSFPHN